MSETTKTLDERLAEASDRLGRCAQDPALTADQKAGLRASKHGQALFFLIGGLRHAARPESRDVTKELLVEIVEEALAYVTESEAQQVACLLARAEVAA